MIVCSKCGSDDIQQEASIMLPINDSAHHLGFHKILEDLEWQDFYWCKKCDDECDGSSQYCGSDETPDKEEKK